MRFWSWLSIFNVYNQRTSAIGTHNQKATRAWPQYLLYIAVVSITVYWTAAAAGNEVRLPRVYWAMAAVFLTLFLGVVCWAHLAIQSARQRWLLVGPSAALTVSLVVFFMSYTPICPLEDAGDQWTDCAADQVEQRREGDDTEAALYLHRVHYPGNDTERCYAYMWRPYSPLEPGEDSIQCCVSGPCAAQSDVDVALVPASASMLTDLSPQARGPDLPTWVITSPLYAAVGNILICVIFVRLFPSED